MKTCPKRPSVRVVARCVNQWAKLTKYVSQDKALSRLFRRLCPGNNDLLSILLKTSALNDFYSTNIYDTHSVAAHILSLKCDRRIGSGDATLVNEMARVTVGGNSRNFYSFASKYCNHHHPEAFPIYDSYVESMLWYFRQKDGFASFKRKELRQYPCFLQAIHDFQAHYGLSRFTLRQIDIYLWLAGKEAFPRSVGRARSKKRT